MTEYLRTLLLFPFELLLPVLGLLLIQSESPINSLIYRSFLGSIAALIYALIGAPDVALTEVMVGTLLSSLIYIVTIRSCYTIVIIVDRSSPPDTALKDSLKLIFDELHLKVVYQEEDMTESMEHNFQFLSSSKLSGSPHTLLCRATFYVEVKTLLDDICQTTAYKQNTALFQLKEAFS
jgi:putative multicomponent Na+:H+ antiporter subunit B